jgi:hypothetical protein
LHRGARHIRNRAGEFRANGGVVKRNTPRRARPERAKRGANQRLTADRAAAARRERQLRYRSRWFCMRRAYTETLLSLATIAVVLLVLVGFDDQVRSEISTRFMSNPTQELASVGQHTRALSAVIFTAAHDQSLAHAPMLIFAIAATVLVIFMLRT